MLTKFITIAALDARTLADTLRAIHRRKLNHVAASPAARTAVEVVDQPGARRAE